MDRSKCFVFGSAHDSLLSEVLRSYVKEYTYNIKQTVANIGLMTKKYWNFEYHVPILMDVDAYQICWEGEKLDEGLQYQ
jgi:hypothetical protein